MPGIPHNVATLFCVGRRPHGHVGHHWPVPAKLCASGTLIQQSKRTQDDHCGKCATGYMLVSKVCKKTSSPTAAPSVSPTTKPTKSPTTATPTRKPTSRAPTKEIAASWHVIEVEFPGIKFDELTGNRRRLQVLPPLPHHPHFPVTHIALAHALADRPRCKLIISALGATPLVCVV